MIAHQCPQILLREPRIRLVLTRTSGADNSGKIAALGAGTANYQLWCKSNLLMLMRRVPLIRFNFVK